ncbi:metal ABC transporter substrate-binding protein [Blastococcus sp. TF02A-30]|uniref:metal ABC transporter substrate-binding protein n=1 Tax=Blastococcus sp. TF02A-30 TaxID=2250580 RepID=UPI000DE9E856|nr:metal ABC transporter substrate-binding protein [Blastococcus sp. TF02A-30]RBY83259.1 zinc ABC transporter substrate-binding protein [Blastococcus sp. TF02A-30]
MSRPSALGTVALACCLACGLAGCAGTAGADDDGRVDVVVSSYPLEYVAEEIGGEHVDVANLTPPGGDTHGLEPSPQDVATLGEADVVVHVTGGLQAAVDEVVEQQQPEHLVDAAPLADLPGDPHFWLDPLRMAALGRDLADELGEIDPERAGEYAANADRLEESLAALDTRFAEELAPCRGATLVASHEAFGYLADRYGLHQVGVAGLDPHVEVSPARLRRAAAEVRDTGARTVFFEQAAGDDVARALADELGLATDVLHPIERVAEGDSYPELMEANLAALRAGLACAA